MEDAKITAAELKAALAGDFDRMVEEIASAMNAAQADRIFADSEEPVRDANAEFRRRANQQAARALAREARVFFPLPETASQQGAAGGDAPDDQRPD